MTTPDELTRWWVDNPEDVHRIAESVRWNTRDWNLREPEAIPGQAYINAVDILTRKPIDIDRIPAWIHGVMTNTARDLRAEDKRVRRVHSSTDLVMEHPDHDYDPTARLVHAELVGWLRDRLNDRDYRHVMLRADGANRSELADELGVTRCHLSRRRYEIRKVLATGIHSRRSKPWFRAYLTPLLFRRSKEDPE